MRINFDFLQEAPSHSAFLLVRALSENLREATPVVRD